MVQYIVVTFSTTQYVGILFCVWRLQHHRGEHTLRTTLFCYPSVTATTISGISHTMYYRRLDMVLIVG